MYGQGTVKRSEDSKVINSLYCQRCITLMRWKRNTYKAHCQYCKGSEVLSPTTHPHLRLHKPQESGKQTRHWHTRKPWKSGKTNQKGKEKWSVETVLVGSWSVTKGQVLTFQSLGELCRWDLWLKFWRLFLRL